ncbi:hypothetical protein [Neorhizobium sp. NCHU2750]|uniref:hypothetical protein n=1 Tax=Neorhizobium sp. NCHU2750 TaxID=1825976 RepID=UPI000EB65A4B|nr:hypothetical protein NCHU2750_30610 [Neorhizobium sp. NCHU2750]
MTVTSKSAPGHDLSRPQQAAEFKPCLWKLLVVTAGILIAVFAAMKLVDDTHSGSFETTVSAPQTHKAG